jgi:hypothetical protein
LDSTAIRRYVGELPKYTPSERYHGCHPSRYKIYRTNGGTKLNHPSRLEEFHPTVSAVNPKGEAVTYILLAKDYPQKGEDECNCERNSRNWIEKEQLVYISESLLVQVHRVCRLDCWGRSKALHKYRRPEGAAGRLVNKVLRCNRSRFVGGPNFRRPETSKE